MSSAYVERSRGLSVWLGGLALVVLPAWLCLAAESEQPKDGLTDADRALLAEMRPFRFEGRFGKNGALELRDKLRKRFPVESLANRLTYESNRREALSAERQLRTGDDQLVEKVELLQQQGFGAREYGRNQALDALHGRNVDAFADAAGFGNVRLIAFGPRDLFASAPRLPFASGPSLSAADDSEPIDLPRKGGVRAGPFPRWPALPALDDFNARATFDFVNPLHLGLIKDREHVTGFVAHHFQETPTVDPTELREEAKGKDRWVVRRLELVSLLKEAKPAVYVSDHLPSMNDLQGVERRSLGTFEEDALPKLRKGENLVAAATTNRIVMLGAVRAAKQCLKCHEVERGDLLGAFSYELQRDPLVPPGK